MLKQSNFFTRNIDMTWKTFVRESCDVPDISSETKEYRLGFRENEAKEAYEEIINEESNANLQLERQKHCRTKTPATENNITTKPVGKIEEKVTVNSILKAVEQKDLKFLLKHVTQENVNLTDDFGWTPLMSAAYCGHLDIIKFLLSLGANKKAREKSGLTAAQLALKKNYLNIVALLKKKTESKANKISSEISIDKSRINNDTILHTRSELIEPLKNYSGTMYKNIDNKEQITEVTGFYCKICKVNFYQTSWKKHETSTLHIFNTKPKLSNAMYGITKQNKGYQMLLSTGWDEQGGLGPSGKGIKYPIKTCLKIDRKGIGQPSENEYRMKFDQQMALKHIQQVEEKAGEILMDHQEIVALDKRRNNDRVGMRALQKEKYKNAWIAVGPLLLKMPSKTAEELLVKDQRECHIEINKLRSDLKIKVNELRDLELNPPVPGLMLQPMSHKEMSVINHALGKSS
ncbi:uncharacterized protein LOC143348814 [Colletes latitarsis]|uniref:uncharacterized protein LOC143348814 n=1 Tax=Colletes latitarsis TaxID=2605962 RepID=UPI004035E09A